MQIIGKCSICGGRVVKPDFDYSTVPSTAATCLKCGAVEDNLPTIKMRPKEDIHTATAPRPSYFADMRELAS